MRAAIERVGLALPALIRLDDATLYDIADGRSDNGVPPEGLAVRLVGNGPDPLADLLR